MKDGGGVTVAVSGKTSTTQGSYRLIKNWVKWPAGFDPGTRKDDDPIRDPVTRRMVGAAITGVASDSQDRVYICREGGEPPVMIFDQEGNLLHSWGNGTFVFLHALSISNDIVYAADKDSHVCTVYTLDGKPDLMIGRHGVRSDTSATYNDAVATPGGPFNSPCKMVASPWGDLYVADGHANCRIHRFDNGGHLIQSWGLGGKSTKPGVFLRPHSVLATKDRRIYVCDRDNRRIQIFTAEGEYITEWSTDPTLPSDIVETPAGNFAITCSTRERGETPDKDGAPQTIFYDIKILDRNGMLLEQLEARQSHGLCVDSTGAIYNALMYRNQVDKYVPLNGKGL